MRPDLMDQAIGRRIREKRRALNISQETLAGKLGVSRQQMAKYESGRCTISARYLAIIAHQLKTTTDALLNGDTLQGAAE